MAVVYLGERDDQNYRKQVAIKMVKPGIDTEQVLHRFRNERQTLAALDHSNIVKLLDGGSSEDGSPYLVMEHVEGLPIDQYCDLNKLSIDDRLRLFREVCSAVQYAHEKSGDSSRSQACQYPDRKRRCAQTSGLWHRQTAESRVLPDSTCHSNRLASHDPGICEPRADSRARGHDRNRRLFVGGVAF